MKGSLIIVAFFVAGIIVGLTHVLPPLRNCDHIFLFGSGLSSPK